MEIKYKEMFFKDGAKLRKRNILNSSPLETESYYQPIRKEKWFTRTKFRPNLGSFLGKELFVKRM